LYFYIFLFAFCIGILILNNDIKKEQKKYLEIATLFVLCVVSGTRYNLGGDYGVYKVVFDSLPTLKVFFADFAHLHEHYVTFGFETGYLLLNSLVKTIGMNFYGFTLIHSVIFYICLYIGLKRYANNLNLLIIVFLYKLFFYNTFISMRQSITIAIFLIAMHYIEEKKPAKYFALCTLAVFFHTAALILFPVYFIRRIKLSKDKMILANVIFVPTILISLLNVPIMKLFSFAIALSGNPIIVMKANNLISVAAASPIGIFHTLEYLLLMVFVIYNYEKIIKIDEHAEFILKLFLILLPIFTLFRGYEILTRIKDYFTFSYGIILGYLCLMDNRKYRLLFQIGTIIVCAYGFFRFIILFGSGGLMPYESYITRGISIFGN